MLVELRKGIYVESEDVITAFFDPNAGKIRVQLAIGMHDFALLEGEDPNEVLDKWAQQINEANQGASKPRRRQPKVIPK